MIKATFRFFYGTDENRILYVYTIELNSLFFSAAFVETTNIISFLQTAGFNILDFKLTECPILQGIFFYLKLKLKIMDYYAYKGYTIVFYPKRKVYKISIFEREYKTLKAAKAWIEYLIK